MFLMGFVLDFIEITFVVVPIVGPALLALGVDPVWLGIMIAINLQTSFLTPPFGFALFYLRGVAPPRSHHRHLSRRDSVRGDPVGRAAHHRAVAWAGNLAAENFWPDPDNSPVISRPPSG